MTTTTKRRRLFFDIETSPNIGFFWTAGYKLNITTDSIIKERAIICICYKWEEETETHALYWDSKQDDKKMLYSFIKVANEADELVGHNGDKFDLAWIRTRCLFHRIDMFPTYVTIDTLKVARSKFRFNSNKLNYIAKYLGIGEKIHTEYDLWKNIVLNKDKDAMDKMIKYCKMDVVLLEKVFKELSIHIPPKTHYGVIFGEGRSSCPECGSDEIVKNNKRVMASGLVKIQYKCKICGKLHSKTDK
jgi:DNA polymerase elongation subunit (family B)